MRVCIKNDEKKDKLTHCPSNETSLSIKTLKTGLNMFVFINIYVYIV